MYQNNFLILIFFDKRAHLLSKIFHLSSAQLPVTNMVRRRDRANAFCEAIRALDATGLLSFTKIINNRK